MSSQVVTIDVVSDVMCPWCYIGKRRLEKAAAAQDVMLEVHWRPFQLDPTIPEEGIERDAYLERKFGSAEAVERVYAPVREAGEAEAIPFAFDKIARSPNTIDAHRLIRWAAEVGREEEMVERLFQLYFIEGGDLSDRSVLVDAAEEVGLDRAAIERLPDGDADKAEVQKEIETAQQMGITGVPTFIVGRRYAVVGAQPPEVLAGAIAKALEDEQEA